MSWDNPRLGQVWSCVDSVEVIIGWDPKPNSMPVHRTLILIRDDEHFSVLEDEMFDYVKESTLHDSELADENGEPSNWKRIA